MESLKARNADNSNTYDNVLKQKLLWAIMEHAIFNGFTVESLIAGANDCGINKSTALVLFPNPQTDIPNQWWLSMDYEIKSTANSFKSNMRIRDKTSSLVKMRIKQLNKFKPCAKMAFSNMATPHNAPSAGHQLWESADLMWLSIGDKTQTDDKNYYTKRLILSIVLFVSISYWLQDYDDQIDNYIDRRIDDALKLGKIKSVDELKEFSEFIPFINHPLKMRD